MFRKDDLSKKMALECDFLVFSGNMIFPFPKNMMLFLRRERKDDLSKNKKKIHENMLSSNVLKRWFFQNNLTGNMIFFVISGKMVILFQRKHDIFMLDGKWKMIFLKKYMETWQFLYKYQIYDIILLPKKAKIIFSRKNTLKGDISDISEKTRPLSAFLCTAFQWKKPKKLDI